MSRFHHSGQDITFSVDQSHILFVSHLPNRSPCATLKRFGPGIEVVDFSKVTSGLLKGFNPDFVISRLLTPSFDILDLARQLCRIEFRGAYRALTEKALPNPQLVLEEVRETHPGLDIDIFSVEMFAYSRASS